MRRGLHAIECRCALCEAVWGRLCREVSAAGKRKFAETGIVNMAAGTKLGQGLYGRRQGGTLGKGLTGRKEKK